MRRDGTMTVVNVKVERLSKDGRTDKSIAAPSNQSGENESTRPVRIKKEKNDEEVPSKSSANDLTKSSTEAALGSKQKMSDDLNDSLVIVAHENNPTIELSDDENDESKMPPPSFVPPSKSAKEKKPAVEKKTRPTRSKQPKRKVHRVYE